MTGTTGGEETTSAGTTETGGPSETTTEGPAETTTTEGPAETTTDGPDETTTTSGHDTDSGSTPGDFACANQKWMFIDPEPSGAGRVSLASDGHARVVSQGLVRRFDGAGTLVGTSALPNGAIQWGFDAAGNGYGSFRDDEGVSPRKWVRKFDPSGEMLWERDLGPADAGYYWGLGLAVAADGTTVYSDVAEEDDQKTRLVKHAADGTLAWDLDSTAGEVVAIGASGAMAALHWNDAVVLLDAAGAELWSRPWELSTLSTAAIDGAGNVVVGAEIGSSAVKIGKFAPDGTPQWDIFIEEMWGFGDLAVNASGEIAVGGEYNNEPPFRAVVAKLDGSGAKLAVHTCDSDSWEMDVAIDDAGTIFASGAVDFDAYHTFVTAFE